MIFSDGSLTSDPYAESTGNDTVTSGSKEVASRSEEFCEECLCACVRACVRTCVYVFMFIWHMGLATDS